MKIYNPVASIGEYEEQRDISLGVFSTHELAKNAVHEFIRRRDSYHKRINENEILIDEWKKNNPQPEYFRCPEYKDIERKKQRSEFVPVYSKMEYTELYIRPWKQREKNHKTAWEALKLNEPYENWVRDYNKIYIQDRHWEFRDLKFEDFVISEEVLDEPFQYFKSDE